MNALIKKQAFEYLLSQLLKWGEEIQPVVPYYSFTRLKALKLLFFTAVVKNEYGQDLLDLFDNFYALPKGPVESDVYNYITSDQLEYFTFKDYSLNYKQSFDDSGFNDELKSRINKSVSALREQNEYIVAYKAEDLVKLSHLWKSWQISIQIATALGKGSYRMDVDKIRSNTQFFSL